MLMSITTSVVTWFTQVRSIVFNRLSHLNPEEYGIGLVLCICIGYMLLRGGRH